MSAPGTPNAFRMEQAFAALQSAHARIAQGEDFDPDTGEVIDIEALQGDAEALLHATLRAAVWAETMADAAKERAREIAARAKRYEARGQALRSAVFAAMDALGQKKVELPDVTAVIRSGVQSALITDEELLPAEFRIYQPPKTDRNGLTKALKNGLQTEGATLSNGFPSLQLIPR